MTFKKIWIWTKGTSVWFCSIIGPRSKVWTEREMIEEAAYEFSEVKKQFAMPVRFQLNTLKDVYNFYT